METVNESKLKAQFAFKVSMSIHLNKCIVTGMLFKPTSKNDTIANIVVIITQTLVIICDPLTPIFLPKKPENTDPNIGSTIKAKYIIYILWLYFLLVYKMPLIYLNLWQILLRLQLLHKQKRFVLIYHQSSVNSLTLVMLLRVTLFLLQ